MPRELQGHKVNPANDKLAVEVLDEPGHGGACHRYRIIDLDSRARATAEPPDSGNWTPATVYTDIYFQNGPIAEVGVNGVTHEALIAIVIDRLECFQRGDYASKFNADALEHLKMAQMRLRARTRERMERGVEGTHEK